MFEVGDRAGYAMFSRCLGRQTALRREQLRAAKTSGLTECANRERASMAGEHAVAAGDEARS